MTVFGAVGGSDVSIRKNSLAEAHDEMPFYFPSGADMLFGVITSPVVEDSGFGILLLSGGVYVLSSNRNRMFVRLARILAGQGHRVLRIDYRGVGESTGIIDGYALDAPNVSDVRAAVDCLSAAGSERIVVVGSCFGARAALHAAVRYPSLAAMVLFACPLGDREKGEAPTPDRVGPLFLDHLGTLRRRQIPTLLVYGTEDSYYLDFQGGLVGPLGALFDEASPLEVTTLPGHAHSLYRVDIQDAFIDLVADWLPRVARCA